MASLATDDNPEKTDEGTGKSDEWNRDFQRFKSNVDISSETRRQERKRPTIKKRQGGEVGSSDDSAEPGLGDKRGSPTPEDDKKKKQRNNPVRHFAALEHINKALATGNDPFSPDKKELREKHLREKEEERRKRGGDGGKKWGRLSYPEPKPAEVPIPKPKKELAIDRSKPPTLKDRLPSIDLIQQGGDQLTGEEWDEIHGLLGGEKSLFSEGEEDSDGLGEMEDNMLSDNMEIQDIISDELLKGTEALGKLELGEGFEEVDEEFMKHLNFLKSTEKTTHSAVKALEAQYDLQKKGQQCKRSDKKRSLKIIGPKKVTLTNHIKIKF